MQPPTQIPELINSLVETIAPRGAAFPRVDTRPKHRRAEAPIVHVPRQRHPSASGSQLFPRQKAAALVHDAGGKQPQLSGVIRFNCSTVPLGAMTQSFADQPWEMVGLLDDPEIDATSDFDRTVEQLSSILKNRLADVILERKRAMDTQQSAARRVMWHSTPRSCLVPSLPSPNDFLPQDDLTFVADNVLSSAIS